MKRSTFFKSLIGIAVAPSLLSGDKPKSTNKNLIEISEVMTIDGHTEFAGYSSDGSDVYAGQMLVLETYKKGNVSSWESK